MKLTISNTVWQEDGSSLLGGRFGAVDFDVRDVDTDEARTLVAERVGDRHATLDDWDQQIQITGQASVHWVVGGAASEPVEYGVRMSFHH